MSSSSDTSNAPFQKLTSDNHGPVIIVTAYIFLITSILAVVVKIWTRMTTTRKLEITDFAILIGTTFATAQTIALTVSVDRGLGRHADDISNSELESLSKAFYASNILLIVALAGAKTSITLLIISIKPARPVMLACYGVLGIIGAWMIAGVLSFAFQCSIPRPWVLGPATALGQQTCIDQYGLQLGFGTVNVLTDLAIVALPFFMMQNVQVASSKRWMVSALFALRILTPAFAICALVTFHTYYHSTPQDRPWHIVGPAIWTQVMLNTSIITACIPSIKRFLADIQSGLMGVNISEPYELTHSGGKGTYMEYGKGTGFGSKIATRLGISGNRSAGMSGGGSAMRSHGEKDRVGDEEDMRYKHRVANGRLAPGGGGNLNVTAGGGPHGHRGPARETSESVKGLTDDVIMHTIDYKVEYEDGNTEPCDGGRSSGGHDRDRHGVSYEVGVGR